ncbi:hypothetical protein [Actinoplanes philippinensis]|uniref:hypothetical protein n=1 Tax=Actinoplanes philippinensis TaxID=35752 RepID=UPI0033FDAB99
MDERPRKRKRRGRGPSEDPQPAERRPEPRLDTAPADDLDARDRSEVRRMRDDAAAARYDRLMWNATLRWLVTLGGLLLVLSVIVLLVKMLGGDPTDPVVMVLTNAASGIAGYTIRSVLMRGIGGR